MHAAHHVAQKVQQITCELSKSVNMAASHWSTVHTSCIRGSAQQPQQHQAPRPDQRL